MGIGANVDDTHGQAGLEAGFRDHRASSVYMTPYALAIHRSAAIQDLHIWQMPLTPTYGRHSGNLDDVSILPSAQGAIETAQDDADEQTLIEQQVRGLKLPPELSDWFWEGAGSVGVSVEYDSTTYFDDTDGPYGYGD